MGGGEIKNNMATNTNDELPNIIRLESLVEKETKQKHWREIELLSDTLNIFTSGFNYMGSFDINTKSIRIVPVYDKNLFLLFAESLFKVSLKMAGYMWHTLVYLDKAKAKSWDNENSQRIKDVANWLNELREQHGEELNNAQSKS